MPVAEGGTRWYPILLCEYCGLEHEMNAQVIEFGLFDEDFREYYYHFKCRRCTRVTLINHNNIPVETRILAWRKYAHGICPRVQKL